MDVICDNDVTFHRRERKIESDQVGELTWRQDDLGSHTPRQKLPWRLHRPNQSDPPKNRGIQWWQSAIVISDWERLGWQWWRWRCGKQYLCRWNFGVRIPWQRRKHETNHGGILELLGQTSEVCRALKQPSQHKSHCNPARYAGPATQETGNRPTWYQRRESMVPKPNAIKTWNEEWVTHGG